MNLFKTSAILGCASLMCLSLDSCKNGNAEFPDFEDGVTAYFAYQYPVRTIVLGDDPETYGSLDNEHKCIIYATHGGAYSSRNLRIDVKVDPSLVNNLTFEDESPVKAMPSDYYSLESNVLTQKKDFLFGTTVTLTDAFFADPDALKNTYVIPLVMTNVQGGADHILTGQPVVEGENPSRTDAASWSVQPKDFVLYCVKYINPWQGAYLRHGIDHVTEGGETYDNIRHWQYVERDEVVGMTTKAINKCIYPVSTTIEVGGVVSTLTCDLELTFSNINGDSDVTVSCATEGMTASGSGKYVINGEKKSYNNQDHNALYLDYKIDFGPKQFSSVDTLTIQTRGVVHETFTPIYNN